MEKIFGYWCTHHFLEKIRDRRIDRYLVSISLAKGKIVKTATETKFIITKNEIKEAVLQGYIDINDYLGIETLTVVTFKNRLITAFSRYSDVGLQNITL